MRKTVLLFIICLIFLGLCSAGENIKNCGRDLNARKIASILEKHGAIKDRESFSDSFGSDALKITLEFTKDKLAIAVTREHRSAVGLFSNKGISYELKLTDSINPDDLGVVDQIDFNFKDTTEILKGEKRKTTIAKSRGKPFPTEMQEDLAIVYGLMLDYLSDKWEIPYQVGEARKSVRLMKVFDLFCRKYFLPIPSILNRDDTGDHGAFREAVKNLDQIVEITTEKPVAEKERRPENGLLDLFKLLY